MSSPKGWSRSSPAYYRSSRLKQYFKEGRGLRTESVICDTRDFDIGRRVCAKNWNALRAVGETVNRRLCDAEAQDAMPAPDVATFHRVTRLLALTLFRKVVIVIKRADGRRVSQNQPYASDAAASHIGSQIPEQGLPDRPRPKTVCMRPDGDPRVVAVVAALVGFCKLIQAFTNRQLAMRTSQFLGGPYTSRQATYDLRRLRRKGLIRRLRKKHRYALTPIGRAVAVLFTKTYGRVLPPGLALFDRSLPPGVAYRSPLAVAWRTLTRALDDFTAHSLLGA